MSSSYDWQSLHLTYSRARRDCVTQHAHVSHIRLKLSTLPPCFSPLAQLLEKDMSGSSLLSKPLSAGHTASSQLIPVCSEMYPF